MTTILIDWSQLFIGGALAFGSDFDKGKDASEQINIMRHATLTTILGHKRKFNADEIVIACDGRNYWRKEIFPHYKVSRKKGREDSKTDWKAIFDIGAQLQQEFKEVFPFKFVLYDRAEADDIAGVLCKWWQTNETIDTAFVSEPKQIRLISNDGDWAQLHKYKNVKQWNPLLKKEVKTKDKHFLLEKIITGDGGDSIPNIKSPDDFFINDTPRQKSITAKIKEHAIKQIEDGKLIYFGDKDMDAGFIRNRNLIDFDYIPKDVSDAIIETYLAQNAVKDKNKIFTYFINHRCKHLMQHIQDF